MEKLMAMTKEQAPFLLLVNNNDELSLDGEFMVVPSMVDEPLQAGQLVDEFLLEANFAGVTGTILSPPNVDQAHNFCTIDGVGGGHQSSNIIGGQSFLFDQQQQQTNSYQEIFLQQQQLLQLTEESNFSLLTPPAENCGANNGAHYYDINFDFDGNQSSQGVDVGLNEVSQRDGMTDGEIRRQFSELEDATWLAERTDLAFIEQITSENEQQIQLLDELMRDDNVFQDIPPFEDVADESNDFSYSQESDDVSRGASEMLDEIYREARQLEFSSTMDIGSASEESEASWVSPISMPSSITPRQVRTLQPVAPKLAKIAPMPQPRFHLADHDFGSARRGRPPGSSKKKNTVKREVVLKSKKRYQNREAASRYRLKKKAEKVEKESELEQMQKRNQFLKNEKYSLTAEVGYLKDLLVEIRKLKGYQ